MRTWGRVLSGALYSSAIGSFEIGISPVGGVLGAQTDMVWVEVTTDANGFNDAVWLTTLAQVLQLNLNESPFYGNYGIPSQQSVTTQVFPDYYVMLTQQNFSQYFLSLLISKQQSVNPTYNVNATANPGAILISPVPI